LNKSLSEKEQQLKRFKSKFNKEEFATETLLEAEDYLASCDISSQRQFYQQSKEKSFERLIKKGFKEREINYICELQREITQLRIQLENLKPKPKLAIEGSKQKNLLLDYPVFSQELAENFSKLLQAKKNFLNAREKTITELQNFFQILEKSFGKHEIVAEIGGAIGNIGGSITNVVTYGIPKIVGEVIKAGVKFSKMKIVKKVNEEFQLSLVENEENELVQLNKSFNDLSNLLKQNLEVSSQFKLNDKLFVSKYQVFDILIKNGI
jgi:hypothetical protein